MACATSRVFFLAAVVGLLGEAAGQGAPACRLPAVFGDHMVLQRESWVPVWGWAAFGAEVEVRASWLERPLATRAGYEGRWEVGVPTPAAGGPHRLEFSCGGSTVVLRDILVGEVWLCSGQSNMEMTVGDTDPSYRGVLNHEAEIAAADHPDIRLFEVDNRFAVTPQLDCEGAWQRCSPESVEGFSATAYFFGRRLHRELGVPIGLISADWGGTLCEAWTSADTLQYIPDFAAALRSIAAERSDPDASEQKLAARRAAWWAALGRKDPVTEGKRPEDPELGDRGWSEAIVPGAWQDDDGDFDGVAWYRRAVDVPAEWQGRDLVLELGPIDDMDTTYWNGERIGGHERDGEWRTARKYQVPGEIVGTGRHVLAVRVVDTGGAGGFSGAPEALRLHPADGAEELPLAGAWQQMRGASMGELTTFPMRRGSTHRNSPTALWNGMLAPLAPFGIRGAIWYQGESNRRKAEQYRYLFPQMIADWRRHWRSTWGQGDFPFYFVQIAPFSYGGDRGEAAALREAQALALTVPNTGMAVTMDIGNLRDIHPKNKQAVGQRLALCALAKTYERDLVYSGPVYRSMALESGGLRLYFEHIGTGLGPVDEPLSEFELAGADGVFHPGEARIDGDTVVVRSEAVPEPVYVRYGWSATAEPNLRNEEGLPAVPFRASRSRP